MVFWIFKAVSSACMATEMTSGVLQAAQVTGQAVQVIGQAAHVAHNIVEPACKVGEVAELAVEAAKRNKRTK